jgi:putative phosphoesterase
MRILVISDVHANWPALQAVIAAEPYDSLMVGGDLVSYGPHPREVIDFIRSHATVTVRGNHDQALAHRVDCRCAPASKPLAEATRAVHGQMLSPEQTAYLGALPLTVTSQVGGTRLFSVHASPREELYRYTLTPDAPDQHLREETAGVEADVVLLGHTHFPMIRRVGRLIVINPGSVGQPRDGDPRASYAILEEGVPELRRAEYDIGRTVRDLRALPIPVAVADPLVSILQNGKA